MAKKELTVEDFTLIARDVGSDYENYYFKTSKKANDILTDEYMEMGMRGVFTVIYSSLDDVVGIEKTFLFNQYVYGIRDRELADLLKLKIEEYLKKPIEYIE